MTETWTYFFCSFSSHKGDLGLESSSDSVSRARACSPQTHAHGAVSRADRCETGDLSRVYFCVHGVCRDRLPSLRDPDQEEAAVNRKRRHHA